MRREKTVTRKELLKGPDEFLTLSSKALHFVRTHSRPFKLGGALIAAVLVIYLGVHSYLSYENRKGQSAYNDALYAFDEDQFQKGNPEKLKQWGDLLRKVSDQHGLSKVSKLALPELAFLRFHEMKYDEAISLYQEYLIKLPAKSPYQSLAKLSLASCYEEKGEPEKAAEILGQIVAISDDVFREQAMWALARVYDSSGQQEKAKGLLKEFVSKYKESPFLSMASAKLKKYGL